MKKYFMTAALALVLGAMAFAPAAYAQGSGKVFKADSIVTPGTAVVQPGFADREREYIGGRAAMVNPGFYKHRQDIFDYWSIHGTLPAGFNANTVGLTSDRELLEIFSNARKVGQARVAFLCGLRGDVSKYDFTKVDYWSLRFANAEAVKNFVFGYLNGYIYGFADKFDHRFAADRSDFIFYSAKETEKLRAEIFGTQLIK